ncbi:MAG TPA: hypothetical protein VHI54_09830 [Actinomycetota bacterium]|nr:hypothetical protein [Actinomycetota bacterium]
MFRARAKAASVVLAAGLFLGACGDGDGGGDAAQAYASSICTAFSTWVQDIQARNQTLTQSLNPQSTPAEGKEQLQIFLDSVIQDTDKLLSSVDAAGVPEVEGGQQAASQIKAAAQSAKTSFENARNEVAQLPTDPAGFRAGAQQIGGQIGQSLSGLGQELRNRAQSEEIRQAFEESPTCAQLRSGTTGGASPGS